MKKLLYCAAALATVFFAGSCQRENLEPVAGGNTVTYTVQLPDAIGTKAIGTVVSSVTELIYEVYRIDENGDETRLYQMTEEMTGGSATVELELVNNQDFRVLFWAQVPETGIYNTDNLKAVELLTTLNANAENYAAFANQDVITYGENLVGRTIQLVRPVAQLNIATSAESLKLGEDVNGENAQTTVSFGTTGVVVEGLSTVYNVAEGAGVAANDGATFTYEAKPVALSENTIKVNNVDYTYVSMNYVGFASKTGDNVKVSYTINTTNVGTITNTVENVPVKANYRTNIIGNLITSTSEYTVTLDNEWPDDEINVEVVSVSTAADLQEAIDNIQTGTEGNIKLEGDIDLGALAGLISTKADEPVAPTYGLSIPADKTIILDLNGCTLKQEVECKASYSMIKNQGNLTITGNGTISFNDLSAGGGSEWGSYVIDNTGYLTVENGTIVHLGSTNFTVEHRPTNVPIQNYAGKVVINGGIISSPSFRSLRDFTAGGEIIINGGQFLGQVWMQGLGAGSSSLTINGGEFNPTAGYDGSSVYINNGTNDVQVSITGGTFNTKIGCADSNKSGVKGCITGGQFKANPSAFVAYGYPVIAPETEGGYYTIGQYAAVAKIGDKEYGSLNAAVAEVEDGQTITLIEDEVFTEANRYNNGGYWDGLGYSGDKSFTIDLGGHTISQNGALNDYLVWIKNVGSKENTITFKNGTMDAGETAYCALCTASSHENKLTVNLENITLINNNSDGSVVKVRGGSEVNIKAGTKITGKDSYLGVENWNAVVNIYDGAEIYMNGTTSYNGCLVGVGGNGTVNVYGGYGKGVSGGLIAMTSGGTINAMGGEWIANTDGTFANSNKSVLVAQSDKQYNAGAGNAVVNVTGGTYKGGYNCYGNAVGDAQINIKGGNFNANPETYVVKGYEAEEENGTYVVYKTPEATVNGTSYGTLAEAVAAAKAGETVTVIDEVTLSESLTLPAGIIFNGNGKQINGSIVAGGDLTFAGHTKVTSFSASYYNRTITIGEGACLEVTGTGRATLGYGNTFNITGSIENAKTADKANVQPSLIIPAGISITGGNDAAMNVTNAYVQIGSTTSKPGAANGKFTLNFTNSIVEFTKELGFYDPTGGVNPQFKMSITNSVFTTGTKVFLTKCSEVTVDNSNVLLGTYLRNSGTLNITNGSVLTGKTIQFGENGGNNGTINVDASTLEIVAGSTGHAFDGKETGAINATNGATVNVDYYKAMTITTDATSTFVGTEVK